MTTTAGVNSDPTSSHPNPPVNALRLDGWLTAELEHVLQRAVDIADTAGHRQLRVQHVALAMLEDPRSPARAGWNGALTVGQWQKMLTDGLPARHIEQNQPRQVTDIFCWRSIR